MTREMSPVSRVADDRPASPAQLDPESAGWLGALADHGARREAALARLHEMLLRIAQRECRRRGPRLRITGPELDDLAYQAAADANLPPASVPGLRADYSAGLAAHATSATEIQQA